MSAGDTQSAWTEADEQTFKTMSARREKFERERHEKLVKAAAKLDIGVAMPTLAGALKENARDLVEALTPYAEGQLQ